MFTVPPKSAARAAFWAAGLNLLAALAMLLLLRPGLPVPGSAPADRLAFITGHAAAWRLGWLVWQAATVALLAFYVGLAGQWNRRAPITCLLALLCGAGGVAADIAAQAIYMGVTPGMDGRFFQFTEDAAGVITGYVGNGLYTLGGILLTLSGASELPRPLLLLSIPVWAAGIALSIASLLHWSIGQVAASALLMPSFMLWAILIGVWLLRKNPVRD